MKVFCDSFSTVPFWRMDDSFSSQCSSSISREPSAFSTPVSLRNRLSQEDSARIDVSEELLMLTLA